MKLQFFDVLFKVQSSLKNNRKKTIFIETYLKPEMLLRPAAEPRGSVVAVAPVVAGHVRPLQYALLAHQVQR